MKKVLLVLAVLIFAINLNTQAEDFTTVYNGNNIYYSITSSTLPRTVAVTYRGSYIDSYLNEYSGAISIPDSVLYNGNYYNVTSIGELAFYSCTGLTSITIPNSVTSIGDNAFNGCSGLTLITIPNSVTSIGGYAFRSCSGLTSVTIGNSVTSIGNYTFYFCSGLTSITIPNSVTSIGNSAFSGCSGLTSITIPNSVTSIGGSAFYGCSGLTSFTIPNSVTSIGNSAFSGCRGLTSITIPTSVTSIGSSAFAACRGLTSITIPNSVTSIGLSAFYGCSGLTSITIGNSVASIGNYAFQNCTSLDTVYFNANNCTTMGSSTSFVFTGSVNFRTLIIGDSVINIPPYAFYNCNTLTSITSKAINPPNVQGNSFSGVSKTLPFYAPCNSIPSYNSALYWSEFTNNIGVRTPQFINTSICDGSIFTDYGANIDSAGVYTLVNGCDSVILNLSITPSFKTDYYDTICKGVQYSNYGFSFISDTNGIYRRELQAINGCDSIIQLNLQVIESPSIELDMVTVDNNNNNVVIWNKDKEVNHYNIYKEGNVLNQYDLIATVPYNSASMFVDTNSNPTIKAYMYKISATDTCLNESELSSFHKTMHLTISQGIGGNWNLYWSPYEGANYTTYNIYRGLNSLDSLEYLTTISSSNTSYTDIDVPSQIVYYQVEIIKDTNTTNKSGIQSIRSNIVTNNTIGLNNIHKNNITTKLYPNPTEGKAKLEIEGLNTEADVLVYDMIGRVVQRHSLNKGKNDLEIDLSGYAKGVYSIRIINDGINQTKKLIVQ